MNIRLFAFAVLAACGPVASNPEPTNVEPTTFSSDADPITDVEQTLSKRQSIGNCWIYATASWAESLHKQQTGEDVNISESYWTYWHWYGEITQGWDDELQTGGFFGTATDILQNYGFMYEADFIPTEADEIISRRQASALAAINASLKTGALAADGARRNRATVIEELNKAWGLSSEVVDTLAASFGDGSTTLDNGADINGTKVQDPATFAVVKSSKSSTTGKPTLTESTLLQQSKEWAHTSYPRSPASRRELLKRVQRALHDRQPVVMIWFVDFNAMDAQARFVAPPATPGRQGGHMVVMEDYQASNVPGYGTLAAGTTITDSATLEAALATQVKIDFIRIKNSWGTTALPGYSGYHDLYAEYLNGPVQQCNEDKTSCSPTTPFTSVVLPAGY